MTIGTACITGITGQTGSFLTDLLLSKGYKVCGLKRRSSVFNTERIDHIELEPEKKKNLELTYGDLGDSSSLFSWIGDIKPDLFFNMAAMSHVKISFDIPEYVMDIVGTGTVRVLEAIRKTSPKTHFLQASSSEMFGSTPPLQSEKSLFHPRSPYATAKIASYHTTVNYREAYNLHASNSIAFNHESYRRSENFVSKKITAAACRIKLGLQEKLYLGNLEAKRDWSHAADMAEAMYLIATADRADDFVIASGEMRSVREFVEIVFSKLDMDYRDYVGIDPKYYRATEVDALCGDASKIRKELGWEPKYDFDALVDEMISFDMEEAKKEKLLLDNK
jgi:GDPmannose 4,6-dehydratase